MRKIYFIFFSLLCALLAGCKFVENKRTGEFVPYDFRGVSFSNGYNLVGPKYRKIFADLLQDKGRLDSGFSKIDDEEVAYYATIKSLLKTFERENTDWSKIDNNADFLLRDVLNLELIENPDEFEASQYFAYATRSGVFYYTEESLHRKIFPVIFYKKHKHIRIVYFSKSENGFSYLGEYDIFMNKKTSVKFLNDELFKLNKLDIEPLLDFYFLTMMSGSSATRYRKAKKL